MGEVTGNGTVIGRVAVETDLPIVPDRGPPRGTWTAAGGGYLSSSVTLAAAAGAASTVTAVCSAARIWLRTGARTETLY